MFDASQPPGKPYPNCEGVAGYIGGNTPHVWTADEWNHASGSGVLRMLPIYVGAGITDQDPLTLAVDAAKKAVDLGWRAYWHRYVALDMETDTHDRQWVTTFAAKLNKLGFLTIEYRSLSSVITDPTPSLIANWIADWGVNPNMLSAPDTQAFQYTDNVAFDGTAVDLSVVTDLCYNNMGRGLRRTSSSS